ncbi:MULTISPECIES: sensor histidine kinase [unclassified Rhizobium]|uniref:sensor histidine kinase n=1 Tax=unclassified Rhizobium TaxID=2613769 RepID=UPI001ADC6878|nr:MULTISPECIES: sensor histidine kinase [unclassified Rhizobium]MBO9123821.1 sensor histidine kinase [Rhizobium sp. 16-488-2b]MBO9174353.1 sensor histidine kinase [Rhizobium sp. 16-488-2a]
MRELESDRSSLMQNSLISPNHWRLSLGERLTLAWQFAFAGLLVLLAGMLAIGAWVTSNLEQGFVQNRADSTALFVDSIVSPLAQGLGTGPKLPSTDEQALARAIQDGPLAHRIYSFKIWTRGATVAYSSDPALIGRTFELRKSLQTALDGSVYAEFDRLEGEEHLVERRSGLEFLEVYSPIRDAQTGEVIGAAEFYEPTSGFTSELHRVRMHSWLVVAAVTAAMLALLFAIVARGSARIEKQRKRLDDQVVELSRLLASNTVLRKRADEATQRTIALNERYLRRISSDLHDGPTQLLGFVIMRLEAIRKGKGRDDDDVLIKRSVTEAINEIRDLCRGLQLPELEALSGREVALRAISAHELFTGNKIEADLTDLEVRNHGMKICLYRFLQEVLSNASRHAKANRIVASAYMKEGTLVVRVEDDGVGFQRGSAGQGLGLAGLQERAASLGGVVDVIADGNRGTIVQMVLP